MLNTASKTLMAFGLVCLAVGGTVSACAPAADPRPGTSRSPKHTNRTKADIYYYYDAEANICYAALYNRLEGTFGVDCTPEVMALVGAKPTETIR